MSSSRRFFLRSCVATAALGLTAATAGCGFQPLYGQRDNGTSVTADLAAVRVDPLRDRVGQQMHNFLRDRLNPDGQPVSPSYRLRVRLSERSRKLGVRQDETATRANLRLTANYSLLDYNGGGELLSGRSTSTTSYDILDNPFASTVSESNARERALREVADKIQARLALYFAES